jgi:hypothetical protein
MPCNDVTEIIEVTLDGDDRLADYAYSKRTCGQGIGAGSLLIDQLLGRTVDDLIAADVEEVRAAFPIENELEEFLALKHFFAIQAVLEVLTGKEPGGKHDPCAAAEIAYETDHVTITGQIDVDIVTDKIKSCGGCGTCGRSKKKTKVTG